MIIVEQQKKRPVDQYYYSEQEWARLGCGPLPPDRDRGYQLKNATAQSNPITVSKAVKGYN